MDNSAADGIPSPVPPGVGLPTYKRQLRAIKMVQELKSQSDFGQMRHFQPRNCRF
jgi:hypothetical protein